MSYLIDTQDHSCKGNRERSRGSSSCKHSRIDRMGEPLLLECRNTRTPHFIWLVFLLSLRVLGQGRLLCQNPCNFHPHGRKVCNDDLSIYEFSQGLLLVASYRFPCFKKNHRLSPFGNSSRLALCSFFACRIQARSAEYSESLSCFDLHLSRGLSCHPEPPLRKVSTQRTTSSIGKVQDDYADVLSFFHP